MENSRWLRQITAVAVGITNKKRAEKWGML